MMSDQRDENVIFERFRQWLQGAQAEAEALDNHGDAEPNASAAEFGLYQLVEEFTALRQELKLQTRSSRNLQEQNETTIAAVKEAIEQFRSVRAKDAQAVWSSGKGLAEALADLDVALERGRLAVENAAGRLIEEPVQALLAALDALYASKSWFARRRLASYHEEVKEAARTRAQVQPELIDALREGYSLVQARLRRSMAAQQLQPIECVGRPVDPDLMTVVEVVHDPDRPPGQVVKEIRRGYTWQGRLLRYAEVQAVRA